MDTVSYHSAIGFETISQDAVTASGIETVYKGLNGTKARITVEGAAIRFRYEGGGDPTTSVGHLVLANSQFEIFGEENLQMLRIIATAGTAELTVTVEVS